MERSWIGPAVPQSNRAGDEKLPRQTSSPGVPKPEARKGSSHPVKPGNVRGLRPGFHAPNPSEKSNIVTIDLECGENASGVPYALGGSGGGLTCYMDDGRLVFEYNLMIIERYIARSTDRIGPGRHTIAIETTLARPGAAAEIVLTVDGDEVARTTTERTVPAAFTASETFDVGVDLGSTVSRDYYERRPFPFDGTIHQVKVELE